MPTAVYPSSLPQAPQFQGYQEQLQENLVRNTTGVGPPKTRPRSTAPRKAITWIMTLTPAQKTTLSTFFETTLVFGSLEFQHQLPDDPATQAIYKFSTPPQFSARGPNLWTVSMSLMIVRNV